MSKRLGPMLAVGTCALVLAACGGGDAASSSGEGASGGGSSGTRGGAEQDQVSQRQEAALKFARCMREQGIDFPDPVVTEGGLTRIEGPRGDPNDPAIRRAEEKCRPILAEGGPAPTEEERREADENLLRFARCMRERGIDLPDPQDGAMMIGPDVGIDPDDPAFQRAQKACRDEIPGLFGGGPGGG